MSYANIRFEADSNGILLLTVNRPQKLNALNRETMGELADAFTRAESDTSVRALIVTGAGEKAFVAGADINEQMLKEHCAALLSPHKRPKFIQIVRELPKSHYGKVQRSKVRAAAAEHYSKRLDG